jgi:Ser/Thr protein kinase RdoA (MazF antagonist)
VLGDYAREVTQAFGLGSSVREWTLAGAGEQGRVWRLVTDRGTYAVKELLLRQDEAGAAASVGFQRAAIRAGVPAPLPLQARSGRVLVELGPHQVRAYEWVDLLAMDRRADPVLVGATVAAVHRVHHEPARPVHPWYTEPVGAERWWQLHRDAVAVGAPFADGLAAEIAFLVELEGLMEPPRNLQNCHRDLWADNILPAAAGGMCIIDWEGCGLEDPAQELPMVLIDFAWQDPGRMQALYGSYADAGGPARLESRGSFTMVIAQFGHFWESAVQAYVTPGATGRVRAHSLERIEELLSQPLRPHHLDDILDAVSSCQL